MRKTGLTVWAGVLSTLLLVGCASAPPERTLSRVGTPYAALPNGNDPLHPDQPSPLYDSIGVKPGGNVVRALEKRRGHALNLLSISGGGQNGAFGAGFLKGWSESGRRPEFDVVGGVSTGALLATHALLGTAADDATLEEMYTQITKDDIYEPRGLMSIVSGTDALRDTAPLKAMIAKYITAETLERVAAAYDDGRLLVVGTTNVDYGQTWIWNMSLIAKAGKLELYHQALLASASFPVVFPPVEIDGHLFVDGAARSNVVVAGTSGAEKPGPPLFGPGNLYLINNGRDNQPPEALRRALGPVAATTISVMMDQSMQTALVRSYFGARVLGYKFNLVAIPDDLDIGNDPLAFDPVQMRTAFEAGREIAKREQPWINAPENLGDLPPWALKAIDEGL